MTIQYTITIEDTQIINGVEYTQEQLQQGLAQVRTAHNQRTGESLTDTEFIQWAHEQNLAAWYKQGKGSEPVSPSPVTPVADWETLKNRALGGDLYPIFERLRDAALGSDANTISTARGDITDAILSVKIEAALAGGLQLLTQVGGYVFTDEEKDAWKTAVDELHFSSLVYLP
jgi:hypothetical protein